MSKKKISKKILIPIIATVLVVITSISIFFVSKNNKKSEQNLPEISDVSLKTNIADIEKQITIDTLNRNIPANLAGKYVYSSIIDLVYEENAVSVDPALSYTQINKDTKDQLQAYLHKIKHSHFNEYISLYNGKYRKQNNNILAEEGFYYGNDNKSYLFIKNPSGTIEQDSNNYSMSYEVSLTGYWLSSTQENDGTNLYVREKILCNDKFLFVTYLYKMV